MEEVAAIWAQKVSLEIIDLNGLAMVQGTCPIVKAFREGKMPKGLTMQDVTFGPEVTSPYSDTSTGTARPLVLVGWRKGIFSLKHNLTSTGPRQHMSGRKCPNN